MMRVLISAVGTRGDVQPLIALALALRELGHEAHLAIPPNFTNWAAGLGFETTPFGVAMRAQGSASAPPPTPPVPPSQLIGGLLADPLTQLSLAARELIRRGRT